MRKIKRSTLNPEDRFRLNVMLSERLGKKLRKESEETHYSQSHIIEMALEEHFSPAIEDERMAIVSERLEFLGGSIRTISELLPGALKAALEDEFARINQSNLNEKQLQETIADLRNRLSQSEKLRSSARKTITELQEGLNKSQKECGEKEATIKEMDEQYYKLMAKYDDCFAENQKWVRLWQKTGKKKFSEKVKGLFLEEK